MLLDHIKKSIAASEQTGSDTKIYEAKPEAVTEQPEDQTDKTQDSTRPKEDKGSLTADKTGNQTGTPEDLPELTRDNIDEYIASCPVNDKGNPIVPDSVFDEYFRILPDGTVNQSGSWRASCNGKLKIFGADPESDRQIQVKGGEALQAALKHRRTMAEDIQILLAKKASREAIATLNLDPNASNQEAVLTAAILQAIAGNVKAQQFLRDTIGEQPTAKQDLSVTMSDDDRKLLEQVEKRLEG